MAQCANCSRSNEMDERTTIKKEPSAQWEGSFCYLLNDGAAFLKDILRDVSEFLEVLFE